MCVHMCGVCAYVCMYVCVCVCFRPSVLDSFSSFSGHMSNLMKQLGAERMPPLHTRVILPLMVSSEKDLELEVSQD